jgi:hypothetical protein
MASAFLAVFRLDDRSVWSVRSVIRPISLPSPYYPPFFHPTEKDKKREGEEEEMGKITDFTDFADR